MIYRAIAALLCGLALAAPAAGADNIPTSMAKQKKVKKCLPMVEKVSNFLIEQNQHGGDATWNSKASDEHMYSALVAKRYNDGESHIHMAMAPSGNQCDAVYTETFVMEKSCLAVREEVFKDFRYRGTLSDTTLVLQNASSSVDVYLSNAGTNGRLCLVTRREAIYE